MQQSPFKFLDAYEKRDKDTFFGREKEVDELYNLVFEAKLILVYGASGVGKTSLIQCGLANRFNSTQWLDLFIRKRSNINQSIRNVIKARLQKDGRDIEMPESLLEALQLLYLYNFKPTYLIFDQFEELFIFGTEEEQFEFFEFIADLLKSDLSCKVILSMREEYIAYLSNFEKIVPSLFDHRLRVEKMTRANLEDVVAGTAKAHNISIIEPEQTIETIIENLSDKKGVDLTNLQVYLDRLFKKDLERKGKAERGPTFDLSLVNQVGELKDVLGDFLDEQLIQVENELGKKGVPLDVLFALVTNDGTKQAVEIQDIKDNLFMRKRIPPEEVDFCIKRFFEMRIFNELDE